MPATRQRSGWLSAAQRPNARWIAISPARRTLERLRRGHPGEPVRRLPRGSARASLLALAPLGVAVVGCGSGVSPLNTTKVEHSIAASILAQHHIEVPVSCPTEIPAESGRRFECRAKLEVGTYPVKATVITTSGHVRVRYANQAPLVTLDVAAVEQAIARSVLSQRHAHSIVTCPTQVLQKSGTFFACSATISGRGHVFDVTEVDDSGHVRYVEAPH
jgi:Domain of unknown function (DUF4333)